ncbi:expressed unknown protein [Seminavis robusta]|uniref:BSD domain-containing protein n=1 Tax=Seminavis robusta TaxID=568900 RepID=A0A9N8D4F3_9STRA|nr:expressed unknown protein [Seminavis robusta]|eukprot:Sro3_g002220.1 n/a (660) ;mRNA; f:89231-91210
MFALSKQQKAEALVEKARSDPNTYTKPLDFASNPDLKDFLMHFYKEILFKKADEMNAILAAHPNTVGKFYRQLVPSKMEKEDFWQRYYYRVKSVDYYLEMWEKEEEGKKHATSIQDTFKRFLGMGGGSTEAPPPATGTDELILSDDDEETGKQSAQKAKEDVFYDSREALEGGDKGDKGADSMQRSRMTDLGRSEPLLRLEGDMPDLGRSEPFLNLEGGDDGLNLSENSGHSTRSNRSNRSGRSKGSRGSRSPRRARERIRRRREGKDKKASKDKSTSPRTSPAKERQATTRTKDSPMLLDFPSTRTYGHLARAKPPSEQKEDGEEGKQTKSKSTPPGAGKEGSQPAGMGESSASAFTMDTTTAMNTAINTGGMLGNMMRGMWESANNMRIPYPSMEVNNNGNDDQSTTERPGSDQDKRTVRWNPLETVATPTSSTTRMASWTNPQDAEDDDTIVSVESNASGKKSFQEKNAGRISEMPPPIEEHDRSCAEWIYYVVFALFGVLVAVIIFMLVNPDAAVSTTDGFCAPIAPYQVLTTEKGKVGIAPWWVFPSSFKPWMFDLFCGDDRVRTMLIWAPRRHTDTSFRLVIGDISTEETLLKIKRLKRVRLAPGKIEVLEREDKVAEDGTSSSTESHPNVLLAVWSKWWVISNEMSAEPENS